MTNGRMQGRNVDMARDSDMHGSNCNNFGYRSIGDSVPDVMTTLPNRLNNGAMANDESKHASCMTGSIAPGIDEPLGSNMMANLATPSLYVDSNVAKSATSVSALKSSKFDTCNVRSNDANLE